MALLNIPDDRAREINAAAADPASRWNPTWAKSWWWLWLPILALVALVCPLSRCRTLLPELGPSRRLRRPGAVAVLLGVRRLCHRAALAFAPLCQGLEPAVGRLPRVRYRVLLHRRRRAQLGAALLPMEHAGILVADQPPAGDEPSQFVPRPQSPAAGHSGDRHPRRRPADAAVAALQGPIPGPAAQALRAAVGPGADRALRLYLQDRQKIGNDDAALDLVTRPSEAMELFFYLFIFGYLGRICSQNCGFGVTRRQPNT